MIHDEHHQHKIHKARELRTVSNEVEGIVWSILRGSRRYGLKFRRQHPIGPYFGDFVCIECKLIVELDGESHVGNEAYDQSRQEYLEREGFRVFRIPNHEVYSNREGVALGIAKACGKV